MVNWKQWAGGAGRSVDRGMAAPIVPATQPRRLILDPSGGEPRAQVLVPTLFGLTPLPAQRSGFGHSQLGLMEQPQTAGDVAKTVMLMRPDANRGDCYAERLLRLPEIGGPKPDVNANTMAGRPEGAVMAGWTPSTRYYNGVTDRTATGRFEDHLRRRDREILAAERGE